MPHVATPTVYTIGHSNHPQEIFNEALVKAGITHLIDVRSVPFSKWNPQFNKPHLGKVCKASEIYYRHAPELGGRDHPSRVTVEMMLKLVSNMHKNADWKPAFMCSEGDPNDCHRHSWLTQFLVKHDLCTVVHLHATKVLPKTASTLFGEKHKKYYSETDLDSIYAEVMEEQNNYRDALGSE